MLGPVLYLIQKEFKQIFRDHAMVRMIFGIPVIQLFIFAYAVTTDLKNVQLAVLDMDQTPQSRRLADAFFTSGYFLETGSPLSPGDLKALLDRGEADMTLWIPKGYSGKLSDLSGATVALQVDGQNSSLAGRARGYAEAIIRNEARRLLEEKRLERPELEMRMHQIVPVTRYYYNPQLESRNYMIPAIVVLLITIISSMLTGMAVVKEKEIGTLEQLMVTPLTPAQLLAGKTIPFVILAFIELAFTTTLAVLFFRIPLEGSLWLLGGSSLLYLLVTLGIGLLASTVSQTQQQAMFTVWFILIFGLLMSGFFFPVENMPRGIYLLTYLNPLRHFMEIVRGVFLKGVEAIDVLPQLIALGILGTVTFGAAISRFKKTTK